MKISLIVTDASPLITLAIAGELDTLLLPGVRVIVPDMVRFEVVSHIGKPGANEILNWIMENENDLVRVGSTNIWQEFSILQQVNPQTKSRSRGEEAAGEILERELAHGVDAAILLFEDGDLKKDNFIRRMPANVLMMGTSNFLDKLEQLKIIDSANDILNKAIHIRGNDILNRRLVVTKDSEEIKSDWLIGSISVTQVFAPVVGELGRTDDLIEFSNEFILGVSEDYDKSYGIAVEIGFAQKESCSPVRRSIESCSVGKVMAVTEHHILQSIGRTAVVHDKRNLDRVPGMGELMSVTYDGKGLGKVEPVAQAMGKGVGR